MTKSTPSDRLEQLAGTLVPYAFRGHHINQQKMDIELLRNTAAKLRLYEELERACEDCDEHGLALWPSIAKALAKLQGSNK